MPIDHGLHCQLPIVDTGTVGTFTPAAYGYSCSVGLFTCPPVVISEVTSFLLGGNMYLLQY